VELERLLDIVAGGQSERLDKLHSRMAQIDFTPAPRKALSESDDQESEGSPSDEISEANDLAPHLKTVDHWSEDKREFLLQLGKRDGHLSAIFPEFGVEFVSIFPADGDEPGRYEESSYNFPADILALGAHMPHMPQ
jgi:hypothetical protein